MKNADNVSPNFEGSLQDPLCNLDLQPKSPPNLKNVFCKVASGFQDTIGTLRSDQNHHTDEFEHSKTNVIEIPGLL